MSVVILENPNHGSSSSHQPHRIAIVGGGPRGMYALESLSRHLATTSSRQAIEIVMFEPSPFPGAGNIYAPNQPHHLRMNFAAMHIDAWRRSDPATDSDGETLCDWLERKHPEFSDPTGYPPRAIVGEYLSHCFWLVRRSVESRCTFRLQQARVDTVVQSGSQWMIKSQGASSKFDHLIITTGHESLPSQTQGQGWRSVFPVDDHLGSQCVPAGSIVRVRGFGLTWIDAALSLTEGRGGQFVETSNRYTYCPSGYEPKVIRPHSRSGRPMLAKPLENLSADRDDDLWDEVLETIRRRRLPRSIDFGFEVLPIVLAAAQRWLQRKSPYSAVDVSEWFKHWCRNKTSGDKAVQIMKKSYRSAVGCATADAGQAIGVAWRSLYPAIVDVVSHNGLASHDYPAFWNIAAEMERIAFGPPAENVRRIIALIEAGIVDCSELGATDDRLTDACINVNAVIPRPHQWARHGLVQQLLDQRLAVTSAAGGISVDCCGRPLSPSGHVHQNLAIYGRATEGCVLGNDTLSRTLHDDIERGAQKHAAKFQTVRSP